MKVKVLRIKYGTGNCIDEYDVCTIGVFDDEEKLSKAVNTAINMFPDCRVWINIEAVEMNNIIRL